MTNSITKNKGQFKEGQSGNPKGRPKKDRALTELLRLRGQAPIRVGDEQFTAQDIVAQAVWQLAVTGEVWLAGRRLAAESVTEWVSVVKWIYSQIEPPKMGGEEVEPEMVVRVVRGEVKHASPEPLSEGEEEADYPLPPRSLGRSQPSPLRKEGE